MSYFKKTFIDHVAVLMKKELAKTFEGKEYAALLFAVEPNTKIQELTNELIPVHTAINLEIPKRNPNRHAEIEIIDKAGPLLFKEMFKVRGDKIVGRKDRKDRDKEFYLFINTRPCPKCTSAILDAQIFNTYFFYDNGYMRDVSEMIIKAKSEAMNHTFTFEEIDASMCWRYQFR